MKKINIIITVLLTFFSFSGFSQLKVNAGDDTTYCTGVNIDTLLLGKNAIIKNGVPPYTISWECKVSRGLDSFFTASDLLSDTTVIEPYFRYVPNNAKWINFLLHITDSENNYAKDSINIRFSKFTYLTGYHVHEVQKGDSILFNQSSVGGGIEPLRFHWQPTIGLTNPDTLVTWCKTDSLTQWRNQYDIIAMDSCGCVSAPNLIYEIRVLPTGIDKMNVAKDNLNIRQEGTRVYFDNPFKKNACITLFSIEGSVKHHFRTTDNYIDTAHLLNAKGIYIVKISVGKITVSKKILNHKI